MSENPDLIFEDALLLIGSGNSEQATELLGKACCLGVGAACIELARIRCESGDHLASQKLLDGASELADARRNSELHRKLSLAYRIMLGSGDRSQQDSRSLHHLEAAATLGSLEDQESLAHFFHFGLNGVPQDTALFERWAQLAGEGGSELATCEYVEHLLSLRREVPREWVDRVLACDIRDSLVRKVQTRLRRAGYPKA